MRPVISALLICRRAALVALLGTTAASAEPAIGQFEVKDLDSTPGEIEFQSQNAHMSGQPGRRFREENGEFEYDDNAVARQRHALELEFGITHRLKSRIGVEFEKERLEEPTDPTRADSFGDLELSEIGAEAILILDPVGTNDWGFGLVAEYEQPIDDDEPRTLLAGVILQGNQGRWWGNTNLYVVQFFGGEKPRDDKRDFAYAAQFGYVVDEHWRLALEAYGTVDRIGNSGARDEAAELFGDHDQHRAGPLIYYTSAIGGAGDDDGAELLVGVGVLVGLNGNTPDTTLKWTVEVEF